MTQLKAKNPQMFQKIEQVRNNNGNPMDMLKDITKNYTPEQINGLFEQAKNFGIPEDVLKQAQNGIKGK